MRTRLIALLISRPKHSRAMSAFIVIGLSSAIGAAYVSAQGTITTQGLYLLPLILAVSWLGFGWGITVALLSVVFRLLGDFATTQINPDYYFADAYLSRVVTNRISGLLLYLFVVVVIHELIMLSRQLEERVRTRTTALEQAVAARERLQHSLFEAGMRERGSIGRDLHDGLGQHLTATAMAARILTTCLSDQHADLARQSHEVENLIKDGITQTRQIARGLLLESVPPAELIAELEELVEIAAERYRIPCALKAGGQIASLDINTSSHLFYIAREALRNALRHALPTRVDVELEIAPAEVTLKVTDDGGGIPGNAPNGTGMGLRIMAQRAEFIGGVLEVLSPSPIGTCVCCRVPLPATG